jgi:hypothetical protein
MWSHLLLVPLYTTLQRQNVDRMAVPGLLRAYLLTPWSRVLLVKLTGFAANQEIPRILWNPKVHCRTHERFY